MEPVEPLGLVAGRWAHVAIRADARDLPFPLPSPSEVFQGSTPCFFLADGSVSLFLPGGSARARSNMGRRGCAGG